MCLVFFASDDVMDVGSRLLFDYIIFRYQAQDFAPFIKIIFRSLAMALALIFMAFRGHYAIDVDMLPSFQNVTSDIIVASSSIELNTTYFKQLYTIFDYKMILRLH